MAEGKKIKITQTGSHIGRTEDQRAHADRPGAEQAPPQPRARGYTPSVRGMINKVRHLVRIDEEAR